MRLLNRAFFDEPRMISPEVPVLIYRVDMVLDLRHRNLFDLAIEVSSPITKYFRSGYPTPAQRIRDKILMKKGYKKIEIDTSSLEGFKQGDDELK